MPYFAEINESNVVVRVIAATQEFIDTGSVGDPNNWIQTSYNTKGGVHCFSESNIPTGFEGLRKNYAGVGYTYDAARDAFIPPKPYPSWTLNEQTCLWEAPTSAPADANYRWDEDTTSWILVED